MKSKGIKIFIAVLAVILAVAIAVGAYIMFGIVGIETKKTVPQSEAVNANTDTGVTVIDETVTYQVMEGFGASACWWSQDVGLWENSEDILSYLYDSENGIGLNIYRYNLGAGSKGDSHILTENRKTECFLQSDGTYDFTVDAAAQKCLAEAKSLYGDDLKVSLFVNSPPVSLTVNGLAYGSPVAEGEEVTSNLDSSNYEAFADYCYNVAEYFVGEGYNVTDVSPINEPQYSWTAWDNGDGTFSVNQEGCHYSEYDALDLYKVMIEKFSGSELEEESGVKISLFESGEVGDEYSTTAAYINRLLGRDKEYVFSNKELRNYFDTICVHSYWANTETKQNAASFLSDNYSSYSIASTEYCQMTSDESTGVFDLLSEEENGTNGLTIEYGVAMANVIIDDLTILNTTQWNWWTACSYGVYTDGLIYLNSDDHSDIQTSKRLWCLGNFSKFIDEGAVRLACSSGVDGLSSCCFVNKDNSEVVVYVNDTDSDLTTALDCVDDYSVYTTSADYDLEMTASGEQGTAQITVPAMSVVTVVMK
ncbi:MAG: hypothetical protein LIO62_06265 [Clostridiales bacterium]|nr:hypothetical protein [Clostridiales bacterium]